MSFFKELFESDYDRLSKAKHESKELHAELVKSKAELDRVKSDLAKAVADIKEKEGAEIVSKQTVQKLTESLQEISDTCKAKVEKIQKLIAEKENLDKALEDLRSDLRNTKLALESTQIERDRLLERVRLFEHVSEAPKEESKTPEEEPKQEPPAGRYRKAKVPK
jgi:chromosome segregation ATPase